MPDSQPPPSLGPAPGERDLEALLSGAADGPLAVVIAGLRAAPVRRELSGEDDARAAFRAFFPGTRPRPEPQAADAAAEPGTLTGIGTWTVPGTGAVTGTARTLALTSAGRGRRSGPRRPRRPGTGTVRWPLATAIATGVVAAVVVAAAFTGGFSGSLTPAGHSRSAGASASGTNAAQPSATQRVDGTANKERADKPRRTAPAARSTAPAPRVTQGPAALCRELYSFIQKPSVDQAAAMALVRQLSALAGGPQRIVSYCYPYLDGQSTSQSSPPHTNPAPGSPPGGSGSGSGSGSGGNGSGGSGGGPGSGGFGGGGFGGAGGGFGGHGGPGH